MIFVVYGISFDAAYMVLIPTQYTFGGLSRELFPYFSAKLVMSAAVVL